MYIQAYIADNWPVLHVAASDDGADIAVAGRKGVALYNLRSRRWRVFGDVSQERAVRCVGLTWMRRAVVVANQKPDLR
jgi:hypothetical protein